MEKSTAPRGKVKKRLGFTLIELLVTMGIFSILAALISINLIKPQTSASTDSQIQTLISDIKSQQLKSMLGATDGSVASKKHGILISQDKYTLFSGDSFNPADPNNFDVILENNLHLSTTFNSSTLLFEKLSGEVFGFSPGQNTITLTNQSDSSTKAITIGRYGSLSVN